MTEGLTLGLIPTGVRVVVAGVGRFVNLSWPLGDLSRCPMPGGGVLHRQ